MFAMNVAFIACTGSPETSWFQGLSDGKRRQPPSVLPPPCMPAAPSGPLCPAVPVAPPRPAEPPGDFDEQASAQGARTVSSTARPRALTPASAPAGRDGCLG